MTPLAPSPLRYRFAEALQRSAYLDVGGGAAGGASLEIFLVLANL